MKQLRLSDSCYEPAPRVTNTIGGMRFDDTRGAPVPGARVGAGRRLRLRAHPPQEQLPNERVCGGAAAACCSAPARALLKASHHFLHARAGIRTGCENMPEYNAAAATCSTGLGTFCRRSASASATPWRHMSQQHVTDALCQRLPRRVAVAVMPCDDDGDDDGDDDDDDDCVFSKPYFHTPAVLPPLNESQPQPALLLLALQCGHTSLLPRATHRQQSPGLQPLPPLPRLNRFLQPQPAQLWEQAKTGKPPVQYTHTHLCI